MGNATDPSSSFLAANPLGSILLTGLLPTELRGSPIVNRQDLWTRRNGDYGAIAVDSAEPVRSLIYYGDEGCKRKRTFSWDLGFINWYKEPLQVNQVFRIIPTSGANQKLLLPVSTVIEEINKNDSAFDTRRPLTHASIVHNVNRWWAKASGVDPDAVPDILSPVSVFDTLFGASGTLLSTLANRACEQMAHFTGTSDFCDVIKQFGSIVSDLFFNGEKIMEIIQKGGTQGFKDFTSNIVENFFNALAEYLFGKGTKISFAKIGEIFNSSAADAWSKALDVVMEFTEMTVENFVTWTQEAIGADAYGAIMFVFEGMSTLINDGFPAWVEKYKDNFTDFISNLISFVTDPTQLGDLLKAQAGLLPKAMASIAARFFGPIGALVSAYDIGSAFFASIDDIGELIVALKEGFESAIKGGAGAVALVSEKVVKGLKAALGGALKFLSKLAKNILKLDLKQLIQNIRTWIRENLVKPAQELLKKIAKPIMDIIDRYTGLVGGKPLVPPEEVTNEKTQTKMSVYISSTGNIIVKWNPSDDLVTFLTIIKDEKCRKAVNNAKSNRGANDLIKRVKAAKEKKQTTEDLPSSVEDYNALKKLVAELAEILKTCDICEAIRFRIREELKNPLLRPGPFAESEEHSIEIKKKGGKYTDAEHNLIDEIGNRFWDHHTKSKDKGNQARWTPDHQPPNKLILAAQANPQLKKLMLDEGLPVTFEKQRLYVHSAASSQLQGQKVGLILGFAKTLADKCPENAP